MLSSAGYPGDLWKHGLMCRRCTDGYLSYCLGYGNLDMHCKRVIDLLNRGFAEDVNDLGGSTPTLQWHHDITTPSCNFKTKTSLLRRRRASTYCREAKLLFHTTALNHHGISRSMSPCAHPVVKVAHRSFGNVVSPGSSPTCPADPACAP